MPATPVMIPAVDGRQVTGVGHRHIVFFWGLSNAESRNIIESMQLTLASQDYFLLATATGQVSVQEVLRVFKNVIDAATERGFKMILIDFLAVTGELTVMELFEIGKTMAEDNVSKSSHSKVAVIGKPPLVTGFGAQVASNRGLPSMTFSERQPALNWLRAFGSKTAGS